MNRKWSEPVDLCIYISALHVTFVTFDDRSSVTATNFLALLHEDNNNKTKLRQRKGRRIEHFLPNAMMIKRNMYENKVAYSLILVWSSCRNNCVSSPTSFGEVANRKERCRLCKFFLFFLTHPPPPPPHLPKMHHAIMQKIIPFNLGVSAPVLVICYLQQLSYLMHLSPCLCEKKKSDR